MAERWPPLRERLFSRLIIDTETGCLNWTGVLATNGYGQISVKNKSTSVHRVMYELFNGPIPDGLDLDHLCRNVRCASPAHLEAVTHQENVRRSPLVTARKEQCPQEHKYEGDNVIVRLSGSHECRQCSRDRAAAARVARRREAANG